MVTFPSYFTLLLAKAIFPSRSSTTRAKKTKNFLTALSPTEFLEISFNPKENLR